MNVLILTGRETEIVGRALKRTIEMIIGKPIVFVQRMDEAHVVMFMKVRDIEAEFSANSDKEFVFLRMPGDETKVPTSVKDINLVGAPNSLMLLCETLSGIKDELEAKGKIGVTPAVAPIDEEPKTARKGAKRILVIDDTPKHREGAKRQLGDQFLTIASGYSEAMEILGNQKFDVVLSDLYLPMSSRTLSNKAFELGKLVPYGLLLMVEAARQGAGHVAVVTDLGHHDDVFSAAFDHFGRFSVEIEGAKVRMMHARLDENGAKDYISALKQLGVEV